MQACASSDRGRSPRSLDVSEAYEFETPLILTTIDGSSIAHPPPWWHRWPWSHSALSAVVVTTVPFPETRTGTHLRRPRGNPAVHIPTAMTKGVGWTEGEELGITKGWIARSNRADVGTGLKSLAFFEGIRIDMLAQRENYPDTRDNPRYWEARSTTAVRTRWLDHIAPACTRLSACLAAITSVPHTGMTANDLVDMAIARYNNREHEYKANIPGSCGEFRHFSSWSLLRHHPRFSEQFPLPAAPSPRPPPDSMPGNAVADRAPAVHVARGAGDGSAAAAAEGGASEEGEAASPMAARQLGALPMGSKRTKEQAGLLAASAALNKRVKELTDASAGKAQSLKHMERSIFFSSAAMRGTQAARDFLDRTAARIAAEMAEEDRNARLAEEKAAATREREAAEVARLQDFADREAEALARRTAARAGRLASRAAEAADSAVRAVRAGASASDGDRNRHDVGAHPAVSDPQRAPGDAAPTPGGDGANVSSASVRGGRGAGRGGRADGRGGRGGARGSRRGGSVGRGDCSGESGGEGEENRVKHGVGGHGAADANRQ